MPLITSWVIGKAFLVSVVFSICFPIRREALEFGFLVKQDGGAARGQTDQTVEDHTLTDGDPESG